ncbi:MAG TPA: RIP metalloprotease RseP [Chthoniobacterales bacterium]|jgi:regulator of sigma E protease|nr:RIP metalloprotease RseP [Chthoniobacterales bacterium]
MILHIGRVVLVIVEVLVIFNLLIVVHEIGHFLAARWRGLYIEKFGVWFGKPLWQRKINGVQYSLGSLPFGGFVALPQLAPMDIIEGKADVDRERLPPVSALDKIIVAVAGPFFSLLLAFVFAVIVWVVGYPVSESDTTTVIGYIMPDSPAEKADLHPGDRILEVDGKRVTRFLGMNDSVSWAVVRSEGETVPVKFERSGQVQTVNVEPYKSETGRWRRKSVRQLLILPAETAIIDKVELNSPAAAAGLRPRDIIRGFNHTPIYNPIALLEYIKKHPDETLILEVERNGSRFEVPVKPVPLPTDGKMQPRIGIQWDTSGIMSIAHPSPIELIRNSVTSTLSTLGAVASPKSDVKLQHLSGPIGIGRIYYLFFVSERGWQLALWLSVVLNVNLAILNMLPIPVLDGGHILFGLIESVRRKPLNMRVLEVVQGTCTILIVGVIIYITFFDLQDLPFVKHALDKYAPQSQAKDRDVP